MTLPTSWDIDAALDSGVPFSIVLNGYVFFLKKTDVNNVEISCLVDNNGRFVQYGWDYRDNQAFIENIDGTWEEPENVSPSFREWVNELLNLYNVTQEGFFKIQLVTKPIALNEY